MLGVQYDAFIFLLEYRWSTVGIKYLFYDIWGWKNLVSTIYQEHGETTKEKAETIRKRFMLLDKESLRLQFNYFLHQMMIWLMELQMGIGHFIWALALKIYFLECGVFGKVRKGERLVQ